MHRAISMSVTVPRTSERSPQKTSATLACPPLLSGSSELQVHLTGEFGWGRWRCGEVGEGAEVH